MRLDILLRNGVLGVALAGLIVTGASAQAQDKDAAKDAAKAQKDATKDAAKANKDAAKDTTKAQKDAVKDAKLKKDKDQDPKASTNKTKGKHKAIGHSH